MARITRDDLRQLAHLLRPLSTRIVNMVGRGVVQLVNDAKKLQLVQLDVLKGETVEGGGDGGEHFQPYGFSSVPLAGAEAVVLFPNGDRSHPIVISTPDRRYRPSGGAAGDVNLYHYSGSKITMLASGDIDITPAPGGKIIQAGAATGPIGEGVVVGTGIDPFTGATYNTLGNASSNVFAKK